MLTDSKVLYAPISVQRTKSVKVTVTRAKSKAFKAVSAERTAELVANATGFQRPIVFKEGDVMDARIDNLQGEQAAYKVFSWEKVTLAI